MENLICRCVCNTTQSQGLFVSVNGADVIPKAAVIPKVAVEVTDATISAGPSALAVIFCISIVALVLVLIIWFVIWYANKDDDEDEYDPY